MPARSRKAQPMASEPRLTRDDIINCRDCMEHYYASPALAGAAASVGIEHGRSSTEMLYTYLGTFHQNGHQDIRKRSHD